MHQQNINEIMKCLDQYGRFITPIWTVYALCNGVLEYENRETGKRMQMTKETFMQDFLPKQPNFVRLHVVITSQADASIMIPDDVYLCDYGKYAMEHKEELFDSDSDEKLFGEYNDIIDVVGVKKVF